MTDPIEEARALVCCESCGAYLSVDGRTHCGACAQDEIDRLRAELAAATESASRGWTMADEMHVTIRDLRAELAAARELHASFPGSPLASEVIAGQAAKIEAMSAELAAVKVERDDERALHAETYGTLRRIADERDKAMDRAEAAEAALAKVTAERDEARAELSDLLPSLDAGALMLTQVGRERDRALAALAKVTAERDDADRRAGAAERRAEEARAALDQACGDEVERAKDAAVLDAWDALRSLAAVDADAQEAQIGPAVDRLIARVRTAEAELAAAREAMPTDEECSAIHDVSVGRERLRLDVLAALAVVERLAAYRAAQPAASAAAAPDLPELCAVCSCTRRLGDYCPTPDPACVVHGTGRADGGGGRWGRQRHRKAG